MLDAILDNLLKQQIITPSCSPWASPVHLVKKKDRSFRLVHDYRIINSRTKKQKYSLPDINDSRSTFAILLLSLPLIFKMPFGSLTCAFLTAITQHSAPVMALSNITSCPKDECMQVKVSKNLSTMSCEEQNRSVFAVLMSD